MPSSEKSSPVAPAVENALGLFAGEDEVARGVNGQLSSYHVFSYRDDFEYLWGIGSHGGRSLTQDVEGECSVILINDGIPEGSGNPMGPDIDVAPYITAYDWAVHFFLSSVAGNQIPRVRLLILDVTPQQSEPPFAAKRIPGLLPLMPWLRVYRLFDDLTELQTRSGHFGIGFTEMVGTLVGKDRAPLGATDRDVMEAAEERIQEAWVNNLTKPEGRHAVSNLVAPLVLAEGLGEQEEVSGDDSQRAALAKLLRTLGVLGRHRETGEQASSPLDTPMVENNIFDQFDQTRFLLLDDQAAPGYHDVLASLLFGDEAERKKVEREGELETVSSDGSGSLRSITDPGPLVESLFEVTGLSENLWHEVDWSQPRVIDSLAFGEDGKDPEFDVLLLDLRLFGTEAADRGETEFLDRLVKFYKESGAESIDDDQLERAVEAADRRTGDENEEDEAAGLMHLALLPLLLSYVDPSLPVVLFSSTRQQALMDALAHRPNVITSFRKPVVSGYSEEMSARDFVAGLSEAIVDALRLHEARGIWRQLVDVEWKRHPVFEVWDKSWDTRKVYNIEVRESAVPNDLPDNPWRKMPRVRGGRMEPHLHGKEATPKVVRTTLTDHYVRYVVECRYFDYVTVPWELLEGALVPEHILNTPWIEDAAFELPQDLDPRNYLARALHHLRNKKAHGFARPPSRKEKEERDRIASIIIFFLFLDFLEGRSSPRRENDTLREMRGYLRARYEHIDQDDEVLTPKKLRTDTKVQWLDTVAFIASFAKEKAVDSGNDRVFLSEKTITSIDRTVHYLTEKFSRIMSAGRTPSGLWIWLGNQDRNKKTIASWLDPQPVEIEDTREDRNGSYYTFANYGSAEETMRALGGAQGRLPDVLEGEVKVKLRR